ncbi:hypothetical protein ACFL38_02025 [Candidatus Omnitrophota bacterium]
MTLPHMQNTSPRHIHCRGGQALIDYTIMLIILIATVLIMQYYIRNSLAGKFREGADVFSRGEVYAPDIDGVANPSNVEWGF